MAVTVEALMLRSYRKELVSNAFIVNGAAVAFEVLDGNRGVLTLDSEKTTDQPLIAALDAAAAARRGGIVKISQEQAADLKKNWPYNPSRDRSRRNETLRIAGQRPPSRINPVAEAVDRAETNAPAQALPIIPGITAPKDAAPVPAPATPPNAVPDQSKPVFKPATRRIRRNPAPLDQPPGEPTAA